MTTIRDKLKAKLAGAGPPLEEGSTRNYAGLLGDPQQREQTAEHLRQKVTRESTAPLEVLYVFDTTASMEPYIKAAQRCMLNVGQETLSAQKGIEARVLGVSEHLDRTRSDFSRTRRRAMEVAGAQWLGDYGQDNSATKDPHELERQINFLVKEEKNGNDDIPEAYECMAGHIVEVISQERQHAPNKKHVVIWIGDSYPHQPQNPNHPSSIVRNILTGLIGDYGCPSQKGPEQLVALAGLATRSYWVDVNPPHTTDFQVRTYGPLQQFETAHYLRFAEAQDILPQALIGMVKEAESKAALQEYLAQLGQGTAAKVAGLLGTGRK